MQLLTSKKRMPIQDDRYDFCCSVSLGVEAFKVTTTRVTVLSACRPHIGPELVEFPTTHPGG